MDMEELNEVATLLHVTSEIATNHPKLSGISRACQKRLDEINMELIKAEAQEAEAKKKDQARQQAADFRAPKPSDDEPVEALPDNSNVEVERRV